MPLTIIGISNLDPILYNQQKTYVNHVYSIYPPQKLSVPGTDGIVSTSHAGRTHHDERIKILATHNDSIVIDDWEFDCIPFFGNDLRCEGYYSYVNKSLMGN